MPTKEEEQVYRIYRVSAGYQHPREKCYCREMEEWMEEGVGTGEGGKGK